MSATEGTSAVKSRGGGGNLRSEGTPAAVFVATVGGGGNGTWMFGMGLKTDGDDRASTAPPVSRECRILYNLVVIWGITFAIISYENPMIYG